MACAELAGHLDETRAVFEREKQRVERLLRGKGWKEKACIGRGTEGRLAQAEVPEVVHRLKPCCAGYIFFTRSSVSRRSCSHTRSESMIVGLSRMTSSFFSVSRVVVRNSSAASPESETPETPPRTSLTSVRIKPPIPTIDPSLTRTMVSVSRIVLRAVGTATLPKPRLTLVW